MRFRTPLFASALPVLAFPAIAVAQTIPFFGPIVPSSINQCPAGWTMLITVANNIIVFSITIAIVFIAPLMIAWAGFLFVVNPVNASGKEQAKSILWHTLIGILIALSAWFIVSAVMTVLYKPDPGAGFAANWAAIIQGNGDPCLQQAGSLQTLNQIGAPSITGVSATGVNTLSFGTGACDSSTIQQAAAAGNYTLTTAQANTLACLAKPESTCGTVNKNYKWGNGSSAAGAFQVTLQGNSSCYDNAVCSQAAGVTGNLNCASAFSGGNPKTDAASQKLVQECLQAAANLNCSTTAAACVLQKQGFSAWTADAKSSVQAQCISTYNI